MVSAAAVDLGPLLQASLLALVGGIGLTVVFALGLRIYIAVQERRDRARGGPS